jgi:hypothetical protein
VTVAQLAQALPSGTTLPLKAPSIRCEQGWAVAEPDAQVNGIYVFRYNSTSKRWALAAEGSSMVCKELGMPVDLGRRLAACGS